MQAQDFQGKHMLPARHVDWLIYILRNRVVLKYALREQEKCSGRVYNADARKRVNDAILAAKAQKEGPKKISSCEFTFISNSEPGRTMSSLSSQGSNPNAHASSMESIKYAGMLSAACCYRGSPSMPCSCSWELCGAAS
jgi:hypothetical protein